MNIYFACSITGGRNDEAAYQQIVAALLADGHIVPTASLADSRVTEFEGVVEPGEVYRRDVGWIEACDLLVAEVSTPSHGVGYEIGYALSLKKPVICLHKDGKRVSKMITGNPNLNLKVLGYTSIEQAIEMLRANIEKVKSATK